MRSWLARLLCGVLLIVAPGALSSDDTTVVVAPPTTGPAFDQERTIHRIEAEDLEALQVDDGVAAAAQVPGVTLQRTNRGAGTPLIRGLVGPQNLIVIDDVRFDLSTFRTGPNQYAALADPLGLDAVEVTLGPGAVRWGTGAVGGVLRYLTPGVPEEDGHAGRFVGRIASADMGLHGAFQLGGRSGPVAGWVGGSIRHHGTLRTGGGGQAPMSAFDAGSWRGKLVADLGAGWNLTAAHLGTAVRGAGRTDKLGRGQVRVYDNDDTLSYVRLQREDRSSWLRDLRFTLAHHHLLDVVERFDCAKRPDGSVADRAACVARAPSTVTRRRESRDTVEGIVGRGAAEMRLLDELLVIHTGVEGRFEQIASAATDTRGAARGTFSDGSTYGGFDVFAQVEGRPYVDPGAFELVLTGGARLSTVMASAPDVPGLGAVDFTMIAPAFSAGVRALIANRFNVFASFHEGMRAPNLQETTALGDTGNFFEIPNADLRPERADSLEIGVRAHLADIRVELAYFHTWLSDAIVRQPVTEGDYPEAGGVTVMQRVNAERAELDGLELGFATAAYYGASLFGDVSWIQHDVLRVDGAWEPGRRVPPLSGQLGLRWEGTDYGAMVSVAVRWAAAQPRLSSADRKDLRICEDPERPGVSLGDDCRGTPGWAAIDLRAGLSPREGMRLEASLMNLTDTRYRDHGSGFDAPGLDLRLSLRQDF